MKVCGVADCVRQIAESAVVCEECWRKVPPDLKRALYRHNQMKASRHPRYDADAHRTDALKAIEYAEAP